MTLEGQRKQKCDTVYFNIIIPYVSLNTKMVVQYNLTKISLDQVFTKYLVRKYCVSNVSKIMSGGSRSNWCDEDTYSMISGLKQI